MITFALECERTALIFDILKTSHSENRRLQSGQPSSFQSTLGMELNSDNAQSDNLKSETTKVCSGSYPKGVDSREHRQNVADTTSPACKSFDSKRRPSETITSSQQYRYGAYRKSNESMTTSDEYRSFYDSKRRSNESAIRTEDFGTSYDSKRRSYETKERRYSRTSYEPKRKSEEHRAPYDPIGGSKECRAPYVSRRKSSLERTSDKSRNPKSAGDSNHSCEITHRIYLKNLPANTSLQDIERLFRAYGEFKALLY